MSVTSANDLFTSALSQSFGKSAHGVTRSVLFGAHEFGLENAGWGGESESLASQWWAAYIRGRLSVPTRGLSQTIGVVDLFASAGGLSLGAREAALSLGMRFRSLAAVDLDADALSSYAANFSPEISLTESVDSLVDFRISSAGAEAEFLFRPQLSGLLPLEGGVDLLVGGPPCQGHSSLNNYTRSNDVRNRLYLVMPAIASALGAKTVVIENVPRVVHDSQGVVGLAERLFHSEGYEVQSGVLTATDLGWPQTRARHFLIASRVGNPLPIDAIRESLRVPAMSLEWLIQDLELAFDQTSLMNSVPAASAENIRRINWLFDNDAYELPNHERPKCHQDGHTYGANYGRLRYDRPAPTITTGYQTPGRGRYVHPTQRRVLTSREAARIQGFPDSFKFMPQSGKQLTRGMLQKWIGDAVPSPLGFAAALSALSTLV